jgi:hypothetical protein
MKHLWHAEVVSGPLKKTGKTINDKIVAVDFGRESDLAMAA